MSKRIFVTSDTHGCADQLERALALAKFDYDNDRLIHLGDCVDRGPDSKGVVDLLLKIKDLIAIKGNHDDCWLEFIKHGQHPHMGAHGAGATIRSYMVDKPDTDDLDTDRQVFSMQVSIPPAHEEFFRNQKLFYHDDENRFFCHGGFNRHYTVMEQQPFMFFWDRDLFLAAMSAGRISYNEGMGKESPLITGSGGVRFNIKDDFKRVFIGHTPTINWKEGGKAIDSPIYAAQVVNVDTGACFGGKLSLLDITNEEAHILYQT